MRQHRIRVAGLDKVKRSPAVMSGNRLVPEPDDCPIGIAGQLLGRRKNPHDGLQALLDKRANSGRWVNVLRCM